MKVFLVEASVEEARAFSKSVSSMMEPVTFSDVKLLVDNRWHTVIPTTMLLLKYSQWFDSRISPQEKLPDEGDVIFIHGRNKTDPWSKITLF